MESLPGISVIIPTLNEQCLIGDLIRYLKTYSKGNLQIIVSDGGSTDHTATCAISEGAELVTCERKARSAQMNYGASFATNVILYFVHADCLPPKNYYSEILNAVNNGYDLGRFRTRFNDNRAMLKLNAFFTRFDWFICNGGDQTLFFKKDVFQKIKGFNNDLLLMEDYDIVKRARQNFRYAILKDEALVSARKYDNNSWLKVQRAHYTIIKMYKRGAKQEIMMEKYKKLLDYRYS